MPSTEITAIQLRDNDGNTAAGELYTSHYGSSERSRRALLRLALLWGLAGVSLPVPLVHVLLVPGFLIAGPVVAVMVYRSEWARERVEGRCPACGEEITIKLEARDEIPRWTYCPACNTALQITEPK